MGRESCDVLYICSFSAFVWVVLVRVTHDCVHAQWKVRMTFNFIWQVMSIQYGLLLTLSKRSIRARK